MRFQAAVTVARTPPRKRARRLSEKNVPAAFRVGCVALPPPSPWNCRLNKPRLATTRQPFFKRGDVFDCHPPDNNDPLILELPWVSCVLRASREPDSLCYVGSCCQPPSLVTRREHKGADAQAVNHTCSLDVQCYHVLALAGVPSTPRVPIFATTLCRTICE
ncbi:uncharacterized protein K452DRAFT_120987 [Aplosporella prunicola CBS 121167]|uniref:Uncharacterized protein n=1 Tax=Aplosporella prunicola CBS 121167 TaxID=1176127 RepID=A0A6A6BN05_9PEZI|nr:uncharacterized protein K452DRAFT_120987 [Aplosporella prunicola CBS 121167]KAF2145512.1 hypothetical protein K452DRAFT_120987 [Aplosporella prunicola CBS 121167]